MRQLLKNDNSNIDENDLRIALKLAKLDNEQLDELYKRLKDNKEEN